MKRTFSALVAGLSLLAGCSIQYTPISFVADGDRIVATGAIDHTTLDAFQDITAKNPGITTLVLKRVEGSVDDDANVVLGRMVREAGFDTLVPADGLIASGGTDLFLAGNRRTLEPGACVGVHSWGGWNIVATELPTDHPEHDRYLDYYRDLGIDPSFYWFTLEAAPAESTHWMTSDEADRYAMTTGPSPRLGTASVCDARLIP